MKLKELNEAIATACNVRPQLVTTVQAETFRQLRASLDKGEKVIIPEFGIFVTKEVAATDEEPAKKVIRFKVRTEGGKRKKAKEGGGEGKKEAAEEFRTFLQEAPTDNRALEIQQIMAHLDRDVGAPDPQ